MWRRAGCGVALVRRCRGCGVAAVRGRWRVHEAKVEEDDSPIICEHQVALVWVGVHEAREDERCRARLHCHPRHAQPGLRWQNREVRALHPLECGWRRPPRNIGTQPGHPSVYPWSYKSFSLL